MVVYILAIVVLLALSILLLHLPQFERLRKHDKTFSFFLSLLSTFIGFFIALTINTQLTIKTEKGNLVKLLKASNLSIENSEMKVQGMYLNPAVAGENLSAIVQYAPLEMPRLYTSLETNTLVSNYFSENAFQAYILCTDNMQGFIKKINTSQLPDDRRIALLKDYKDYLSVAKQINTIEMKRLDGEMSVNDETTALQNLAKSLNVK